MTESFSWQWYYWYLTDEGIEYLRDYLHLPADAVPNTLKKTARMPGVREGAAPERAPRAEGGAGRGGGGYGDKKAGGGAPDGSRPSFQGGAGGAPAGGFGRGDGGQ